MTFTISKSKLAVAIIAVALAVPSTAMAFHVFDDVADDKFYADPVEWAFDNGITTGKTASTFAPDDGVTRGEAVTFLKRYNDNVVAPTTLDLFDHYASNSAFSTTSSTPEDTGASTSVTIPEGHTGTIQVIFAAESACYGSTGYCILDLSLDGALLSEAGGGFAFDSSDSDTEGPSSWESHATMEFSDSLPAGTYEITAEAWSGGTTTFRLDEIRLSAEVHLTS